MRAAHKTPTPTVSLDLTTTALVGPLAQALAHRGTALVPFLLACPRCGGRMRVVATVAEPAVVRRVLEHLGLASGPVRADPAQPPPEGRQERLAD